MAKKPETVFRENKVIPFLKTLKNTAYFPIQQIAIHGDPDFMLCCAGRFVGLEIKKDADEEPMAIQSYKLNKIERCGGKSFVIHPQNFEDVKQQIVQLDGEKTWKKLK